MISITPLAQEKLTSYLAENKVEPQVRVYLPQPDCSGAGGQISLALDQPDSDDILAEAGELKLFMTKSLYDMVGKVVIDFEDLGHDSGFVVKSEKPVPQPQSSGCHGCTSCC